MKVSLEAARVNKKLRQEDAAKALNVSKKTLSSWENGITVPKLDMVEALCKLYDATYDDIRWQQ